MKEKLTIQAFLEKYKGEYVMNCDTEEKARKFLTLLDSAGRKWNYYNSSYLDFRKPWEYWSYGEKTCYNFNKGVLADVNYYISLNYTILKFEDFEFVESEEIKNMKNIEIELYRRGSTVFGWCNYLRGDLRGKGVLSESENQFELYSSNLPQLANKRLYVIGEERDRDDKCFMHTYQNTEQAIEVCNSIKECVDKLNAGQPKENFEIERII